MTSILTLHLLVSTVAYADLAELDVIEEEGLQQNARAVGAYLSAGLDTLADSNPLIGQVRGSGLYLGVELIEDHDSRAPATRAARSVYNSLRERGVLIGVTGPHANVLKLRPPLVFTRDNADCLLERLEEALNSAHAGGGRPDPPVSPGSRWTRQPRPTSSRCKAGAKTTYSPTKTRNLDLGEPGAGRRSRIRAACRSTIASH